MKKYLSAVPKQIIYPIHYLGLQVAKDSDAVAERFRGELKELTGCRTEPLMLGRARMGIFLLVQFALTTHRRKVLLSPYTIPDVVNMVLLAGAEPVFVDFEPDSTYVDVDHLASLMSGDVACVIITHYHVNQKRMEDIKSVCNRYGAWLFEDCAISFGGSIKGKHVGLHSDGGVLSLSGYKFLNYFWGGAILSTNGELLGALNKTMTDWKPLTQAAYRGQIGRVLRYDLATRAGIFDLVTFPYLRAKQRRSVGTVQLATPRIETKCIDETLTSLPSAQAYAEWHRKLPVVADNQAHRLRIASIYRARLSEHMVGRDAPESVFEGSCFANFPVLTSTDRRDDLYRKLMLDGIDVGLSLYPCCGRLEKFSRTTGKFVHTARLEQSVISLPTHPGVTQVYAEAVASRIGELLVSV